MAIVAMRGRAVKHRGGIARRERVARYALTLDVVERSGAMRDEQAITLMHCEFRRVEAQLD